MRDIFLKDRLEASFHAMGALNSGALAEEAMLVIEEDEGEKVNVAFDRTSFIVLMALSLCSGMTIGGMLALSLVG